MEVAPKEGGQSTEQGADGALQRQLCNSQSIIPFRKVAQLLQPAQYLTRKDCKHACKFGTKSAPKVDAEMHSFCFRG